MIQDILHGVLHGIISRLKFGSLDILEATLFNHTSRLCVAIKMTDDNEVKLHLIEKPVNNSLDCFRASGPDPSMP